MAHSLPEDVLYAIFLHALPSKFVLSTIEPSSKPWMVPPLTFSLVCRSWRLLVLSRPKLWRDISFESKIGSGKDHRDPRIKHALVQWLSRSSSSPLWIDLEVDGGGFGYIAEDIFPLFLQERHRWSTFHINARSGFFFREKFTIQCLAPLTSLSLALTDTTSSVACIDLSQNITSDCSHLEHLSIGMGTTICLPQIRDALQLPHLRSLYYGNSDWDEIYENLQCILSASPNLEELKIRSQGLGQFKSSPPIEGPILLPRLRSFSLDTYDRNTSYHLLGFLTCPVLREFTYDSLSYRGPGETGDHVISQLRRIRDFFLQAPVSSSPPLEILNLGWQELELVTLDHTIALKKLLIPLKNLKMLGLRDFALSRAVIKMLTVSTEGPQESVPCPSLCVISLDYAHLDRFHDLTEEAIEELIVSRWKAGSLRTVLLSFLSPKFGAMDLRSRISECIKEGLEVETKHHHAR